MSRFCGRWKYERRRIALRVRIKFDPWWVLGDAKTLECMIHLCFVHVERCNLNSPTAKVYITSLNSHFAGFQSGTIYRENSEVVQAWIKVIYSTRGKIGIHRK